jgi:uncharacterized protein (TIGR02996 family)
MRHEGFLHALRDDPDDDASRLIYADWLDDHGDCERADFIRLQVRLSQIKPGDPERPALAALSQEAVKAETERWLGARPSFLKAWSFRGGLLDRLVLDASATMADLVPLLEAHPVREVVLGAPGILRPLACSPALSLIRSLSCSWSSDCHFLLDSPYLRGLRELSLEGKDVTNDVARSVARSAGLSELRVLRLHSTSLSDAGVVHLLRRGVLPKLAAWHVHSPNASPLGLQNLFAPHRAARWHALDLDEPELAHHPAVGACTNLKRLSVVLSYGVRLYWLEPLKQLAELRLRGSVDDDTIRTLAAWPGLARLRHLCLEVISSRREAVRSELAASPHHNPATALALL